MNNRTLTILKPDAVGCGQSGEILQLIETNGFRIIALKMLQFTPVDAERFYSVHKDRPFFRNLNLYITSGPVIVAILEKENAVETFRALIGNTDPSKATPGTIRHLFGKSKTRNAIHASDSNENAQKEMGFFFSEREITDIPYHLPLSEEEIDA